VDVQKKEDNDWVKKCMEHPRLDGPNCKGRPKMTWLEVVNKDLKELGICTADALDSSVGVLKAMSSGAAIPPFGNGACSTPFTSNRFH